MQSKTSSFKQSYFQATLFRKNLTRFWPLWAAYAVVWFLFPLTQFMTLFGADARSKSIGQLTSDAMGMLLHGVAGIGLWIALAAGALFAMALFSYLDNARSVGMMHSFPIRRETLFCTNYLTGLIVMAAVLLVNGVLIAAIHAAAGILDWGNLFAWLFCAVAEMTFFYSFAVFCAMFTGQILAVPAFYILLNGVAVVLNQTVKSLAVSFIYGYDSTSMSEWVAWLTPVYQMSSGVRAYGDWNEALGYEENIRMTGLHIPAIYLAAGLVLAALALAVYRKRRSETAGDVVSVSWAKQLFRFGAGLFSALTFGQLLYYFIKESFFGDVQIENLPLAVLCLVLLALIGFYAAEMLLEKSFRVFRRAWKGAVLAAVIPAVLCIGLDADVPGIEKRVPKLENVESVWVYLTSGVNRNVTLTQEQEPELVEQIVALQQSLVDNKARSEEIHRQSNGEGSQESDDWDSRSIQISYTLANGDCFRRTYDLFYQFADLDDPDTPIARMEAIASNPQYQRQSLFGSETTEEEFIQRLVGGDLTYMTAAGDDDWDYNTYNFGEDAAKEIAAAYLRDIDAGRVGVGGFEKYAWEKNYYNELRLRRSMKRTPGERYANGYSVLSLPISPACTETVAALKRCGVTNDAERRLYTVAEWNEVESGGNHQINQSNGILEVVDSQAYEG